MEWSDDTCYAALVARDRRFDGLFFVGVSTTGIYCRPVCTARTPGRDRCSFHATAVDAEQAGFRACLLCRPELAPGRATVDAVPHLVARAARLIDEGWLNDHSVEALSDRLGVTARHLRRSMEQAIGTSPLALARSRRLALARRLLTETALPITDVATVSGFGSVRRFNAAFSEHMGRTPRSVRRGQAAPAGVTLRLDYRPPLAWDALLGFLAARAIDGVERVDGGTWHRRVHFDGHTGDVAVSHDPDRPALRATIGLELLPVLMKVVARLRRVFDLDAHPDAIALVLGADPTLAWEPGLRVPGALDPVEAAARAVLGQQVTVAAATTLAGRLCARWGRFPTAAELAAVPVDDVAALGMPRARAAAVVAVAKRLAGDRADLDDLPGVGPWTRAYVAMRTGDPDALPASDLVLRTALGCTAAELTRRAEAWRPWRSYAVVRIWTGPNQGRSQ